MIIQSISDCTNTRESESAKLFFLFDFEGKKKKKSEGENDKVDNVDNLIDADNV